MFQNPTPSNNLGKSRRFLWGTEIFSIVFLVSCAVTIYDLGKVMMGEL